MTAMSADFETFTRLAEAIRRACVLEASAAKPGNVHPRASFPDLTFEDFVRSAEAASPVLARAAELGVGRAIFQAIEATRAVVSSNTNLGIVLLIAPLSAVPLDQSLRDGIGNVLERLTRDDAVWVYRAIRLAQPGARLNRRSRRRRRADWITARSDGTGRRPRRRRRAIRE